MDPDEEGEDFDDVENFDDTEDQQGAPPEDQQDEEDNQDPDQGDEEVEDQPARKPSRAQARIEALDREVRESREREAEYRRELEQLRNGQSRVSAAQREQEELRRLEQMDPVERAEYIARSGEQRTNQRLDAISRQMADSTDRAEFAQACVANPALAKVKDEVETELTKLRAGNVNMPRGTLAAYLIGRKVLEKAPKARTRAEKRAAANLDRERTRPAAGASDAPGRGRELSEKAAREKRLENFTF